MIPYKDDNPTRTFPFVTIGIIFINIVVFVIQFSDPSDLRRIVFSYGAIPSNLISPANVYPMHPITQPIHPLLTLFTSMFMHGGLLHLATNMLYLWIFGDNIEDRIGHLKFIFFYLFSGIAAAYAHAITASTSVIPMIGASGAVAGVLGAYLLLYPNARVHTLIFLFIFVQIIRLPALFIIGFWIVIQFINGILSSGVVENGGVAWFAHIGGFIFGVIVIYLFVKRKRAR